MCASDSRLVLVLRLTRVQQIWLQFQLFAEVVAEVYFARVQDRESSSASLLGAKSSDQSSETDFDQRSVESSASSSNGKSSVASVSPRPVSQASRPDDVDEQRFKTIRLQFASKSWRGRKRLEKEVEQFARFRAVIDFVMSEKIVDGSLIDKLPSFPLVAAFSVRGVCVVATAEPLRDRSAVVLMDKRDLMELVQALKLTKMLRAFPYGELPNIALRKIPGNSEKTIAGVTTRFDDVLLHSLRSSMVHGVLIRASSGDSSDLELLTAHDMNELVQDREAHWIPYLDMVYYQLESNAAPGVENWRAKSFLLKGPHCVIAGDVVVSIDADKCRLPLSLKEGLVARQQLEIHPLVRRLEDIKTSTARIAPLSSNGSTTPQKIDASYAFAKTSEQSLRNVVVQSVKEFASQLATFGDAAADSSIHPAFVQKQAAPPGSQSRSFLTRSNTDPANFSRSEQAGSGPEPVLRRRSSFAPAGAAESSSLPNSSIYVIDGVHLREVMRESGINVRFLPLVFEYLDSTRQPGMRILVASEIVARMAKTLFRFRLFNDENVAASHWQTRKHRLIRFIDSIMHGVFHDDLPMPCDINECVGDQFWHVDAPILLMLGPYSSSAALDYSCIYSGSAIALYRQAIRGNPSALFTALLHAFGAQMADGVLPSLDENRFVSVQFLRNESDLVFGNEADDPKLAMQLHPALLWSNMQFFRLQFNDLKRVSKRIDPLDGGAKRERRASDSFVDAASHRSYFASISEYVRNTLQHPHLLRVEKESKDWEDTHAARSRLVKALRAASAEDESRGVAREYCDEARDIIYGDQTRFPVEFLIALRCLEIVSGDEDEILSRANEWREILSMLRFFYRPANQSQFAKSSSSHPLFSIVYSMIHLSATQGSQAPKSLRVELETSQLQQTWLTVIATVDAHCRRAVQKSWTTDPINAIATKAASFEFERTRTLHKPSSSSSLGSSISDDHSDSTSELRCVKTARAMTTEEKLTAAAVRQDILWFVESFLLPAVRSGSWTMPGARFLTLSRSGVFSRQASHNGGATPAPGVALVWGEPFGLSLDEESQIAAAPSDSRLGNLRARPSEGHHAKVELLKFPSALRRVVQVSCGYRHTALVTDNRQLYTYGYGECGRLGHGDEESVATPTAVSFFASMIESVGARIGGIAQVSCGREHTMAVLVNGDLYGFGWAEAGRLGTGDTGCCVFPTKVLTLQNVQAAACGREHTLVLNKQGEVFAFGAGFGGRLGNGSEADEELPVLVKALEGERVVRVDAGECHSAAINDKGEVFTWGFGNSGALGSGTRENSLIPSKIAGGWMDELDENGAPSTVTTLACGGYHTLVGTSAGKLYGWGDSAAGQLGSDLVSAPEMVVLAPHEIPLMPSRTKVSWASAPAIREISCGTFTSAVCLDDGKLFMWGSPLAGNGAPLQAEEAKVARAEALEEFAVHRIACGTFRCSMNSLWLLRTELCM